VHIADVVGAFLWALQNATAAGIYNLTAPDPVSSHTFSETVGRLLNCKFLLPLPELPLRIALGELTTTLTQGLYVLPHRLLEEGFVFQYARLADTLYALLAAKS
jgi:NAD dependent epimerase/dehydratase family enzyme